MHYLLIAFGGMLGALSRAFIYALFAEKSAHFPIATLLVNLIGCFLMGAIVEFFSLKTSFSPEIKLFLTTGFLGAFTTFSTFGLDIVLLLQRGAFLTALTYALLSIFCGIIGIYLAFCCVRFFLA